MVLSKVFNLKSRRYNNAAQDTEFAKKRQEKIYNLRKKPKDISVNQMLLLVGCNSTLLVAERHKVIAVMTSPGL